MDIHIYHHIDQAVIDSLNTIQQQLTRMENAMSAAFDALVAQVTANSSVLNSAITVINSIADRIAAAGVDPVALAALTNELRLKDEELASAIAAVPPV